MMVNTSQRSKAPEIMDDFSMEGEILRDALDKIAGINRLLGGNKVTLEGVQQLLRKDRQQKQESVPEREIRILDVGCGNGDMLRTLADFAIEKHLKFQLTGIDANAFTINHARGLSENYENINFLCADIFEEILLEKEYDLILCTLTLHHFKDEEILTLLKGFKEKSKLGIVINDLQRSALPYYLFMALCFVFRLNSMSKDDGLVSILRGFKKADLQRYSNQLNLKNTSIRWKWAFRYQWIIPSI
ncbi:Methyltransferase domain-containing protein [Pedobacter steynii]|uniref:Methyltransferase domain-containing protein n=1 Tax=Pedobacter steynii TaxID=430522 RepID=A0A1G9QVE1_9SPHI|nr:methyltransferase domain-containing protein [Pedobacter steynii]NQX37977.1 methyltransferase domain-containing protein [Pedobacter steynii]SDM14841.1 Methyltransferase domain-containing protein [Pedobacter steynii]